jgi:hypothetical protein
MASATLTRYLREGAHKLRSVGFGRASKGSSNKKFDDRYWEVKGRWKNTRAEILKSKGDAAIAVWRIFVHPDRWRFDCSEFIQVVNYYAWLRMLGRTEFNKRVGSKPLEIRPFQGSPFTVRKHYYWRRARTDWMEYFPDGKRPTQRSCMTVREIVNAAPAGSRVLFRNDKGSGAFRNENTIKLADGRYIAHGYGARKRYTETEVILKLYRIAEPGASYAEARRHVWIKEVAYFATVPMPTACTI